MRALRALLLAFVLQVVAVTVIQRCAYQSLN